MTKPDTKNYPWLDAYLAEKPHAVSEYKLEWEAFRYLIGGKMFCMIGADGAGRPIVTLKADPLEGDLLKQQHPDIFPGYYMNKTHWCSVLLEGGTPDETLRAMADASYDLVFSGLTKKMQRALSHAD